MEGKNQLQLVSFYGDQIEAIQGRDGRIYVAVKRVCENLGIDFSRQIRKLREHAWSGMVEMSTPDLRGREQVTCVIPLDSLPMWMVTIHEGKVSPEIREKLRQYQLEARDVLAKHFLGDRAATPAVAANVDPRLAQWELINNLIHQQIEAERRLGSVESAASLTAARVNDLDSDHSQLHLTVTHLTSELENLKCSAMATSGYRSLSSWAREHGIRLSPERSRAEGSVIKSIALNMGIKPVKLPGGGYRPINGYPRAVADVWLANYIHRENERHPKLFHA